MKYLKAFLAIFKNEFICTFFKDARRGSLLVFAATTYLLLFGLLYQQGVINQIPTVILDQNNTPTSRLLVDNIASSQRFKVVYRALNQEDMLNYIHNHNDIVAFMLPEDFEKNVKSGKGSNVLFTIDGRNIVITSVASFSAIEIVKDFSNRISDNLLQKNLNQTPYMAEHKANAINLNFRIIGNPTLNYLNFFVLGLALAAFQQGVLLSVAASFLSNKQIKLDLESKFNKYFVISSKLSFYWLFSMIGMLITLGVSVYFLGIPLAGSTVPLLALAGSFSFVLCAIAIVVTSFNISELTFTRIAAIYTVPAFMLSGFTWPLAAMPSWLQYIAYSFPITYVANDFRAFYLNGFSSHIYTNSAILFMSGLILLIAGILAHKKLKNY